MSECAHEMCVNGRVEYDIDVMRNGEHATRTVVEACEHCDAGRLFEQELYYNHCDYRDHMRALGEPE